MTLFGGAAAAWPILAGAQQGDRMRRIGVLMPLAPDNPDAQARTAAFLQGLQQLGWTVGQNVLIDTRWSAGDVAGNRKYAVELVAPHQDGGRARANCQTRKDRTKEPQALVTTLRQVRAVDDPRPRQDHDYGNPCRGLNALSSQTFRKLDQEGAAL